MLTTPWPQYVNVNGSAKPPASSWTLTGSFLGGTDMSKYSATLGKCCLAQFFPSQM